MSRILRLHKMVRRSRGSSSRPVLDFNFTGWSVGAGNLVPDPMTRISCGMVRGPTGLAFDPLEVRLCAPKAKVTLLCQSMPTD